MTSNFNIIAFVCSLKFWNYFTILSTSYEYSRKVSETLCNLSNILNVQ